MTMSEDGRRRFELRGVVSSVGFESGDRFVIGHWLSSPIGPFTDLMWAAPDGTRHLRVPSARALAFVSGIYAFDQASVAPVVATVTTSSVEVHAGDVGVDLQGGHARHIPFSSIPGVTRWVQDPIARVTMGVRTYGKSPTGVREWYRAETYRRVLTASGSVDGRDLGSLAPRIDPPVRFGFSEPPRRPSMVWLRPLLEYRNGDGHPG
jgi:hypothetical protein